MGGICDSKTGLGRTGGYGKGEPPCLPPPASILAPGVPGGPCMEGAEREGVEKAIRI